MLFAVPSCKATPVSRIKMYIRSCNKKEAVLGNSIQMKQLWNKDIIMQLFCNAPFCDAGIAKSIKYEYQIQIKNNNMLKAEMTWFVFL